MARGPADVVDEVARDLDLLVWRLERRVDDPDRVLIERREMRRELERLRDRLKDVADTL
jgi:hypothetical protein